MALPRIQSAHDDVPVRPHLKIAPSPEPLPKGQERRFAMPSNEMIARFLGASLGGALIGGLLLGSVPVLGALLGASLGAGVVAFRTRHAF
jgi:hypothetical protein